MEENKIMTENISKAQDAANQMNKDCENMIAQLQVLKEVYLKLAKSQGFYNADQPEKCFGINFLNELKTMNYPLPIRGIFDIAGIYPTIKDINLAIQNYTDMGNYWIKIRDQLSK